MANPPTWSNVKLLLHFDGSDGSTTFTDSSSRSHTVTANGGAQVDSDAKFGTGALQCDGDGDYLSIADSDDWAFGTGDFTIEGFFKFSEVPGESDIPSLLTFYESANYWLGFYFDSSAIYFEYTFAGATQISISGSLTPDTTAYHYFAADFSSGTLSLYVDDTRVAQDSYGGTFANISAPLLIGAFDGSVDFFNGRIDELRIVKGESVYEGAASITVPTLAYAEGSLTSEAVAAATGSATAAAVGQALAASGAGSATAAATVSGTSETLITISTPFALNRIITVSVGCQFHVNIEAAVSTITVPFHVGTYTKTISVPFHVNIPTPVATITVPFHVYGELSTEAAADFVHWKPKVILGGADISEKLIGALEIEADEMASVVASFSFLPAAGTVDPLAWVGKTVTISWQRYVGGVLANTVLRFTGVVSDPTWDADERVLSISATSDLQGRLDRLTKTEIDTLLTSVSPRFSEYVFGPAADLSGWEYAQALISTTNAVLWQDVAGVIKVTSTLAKATADYTFTTADIIAGSLGNSPQYPGRQEMVNQIAIDFGYRFKRRRQRQITCVFRSVDLDTPSTYLSGNLGGWELPQRTQVESAATSGGWTVVGDITYRDVWPNGLYSSYSDGGTPTMIGLSLSSEVSADWCIGASWKAARRWVQTVTETATLMVNATESQAVIGILADNESYSIEDDADDEEWESSLEYDDYVSGATLMSNGVDKRSDLDELRDEYEDAVEIAILKAKNDILRAHRGTTVTFSAPFLAALNLSHTVALDTGFLDCKGKVRRITDTWNLDTGDCLSTVDVALYRHNGSGLTEDTTIAAPDKAADPTETAPVTRLNLGLYIGGQDDRPKWSTVENESGYFVNLPFDEADGSATLSGGWSRNPLNPQVAPRIYDSGFAMQYPDIAATYADPSSAASAAVFEVAIPEDTLTIISG